MRGCELGAAAGLTLVFFASSVSAQEKKKSADDEIEESKAALAESQAQTAPPLERGRPPYKPSVMPWVLGGTGGAAIVTGGVFVLVSLSDESKSDDFESLAMIRANPNEKNDLFTQAKKSDDSAKTNMTIGVIAGGAGVLLLGVGIVWALVDGPPKDPKAARLRPALSPHFAGATLGYAF